MSLLIFGKSGQVAAEIARLAPEHWFLGRDQADLTDPQHCADLVGQLVPRAVINAAAYTAVDRAEREEALANVINGDAPSAIARACAMLGVPLVHISTDYVFDGAGDAPLVPDHPTGPLGAYGRSKLIGEEGVRAAGGVHVILRSSWVFSPHGNNFATTMLRLGAEHDHLRVVADQVGGPTPASAIAHACLRIADALCTAPGKTGTYHLSGCPDTSWADFARAIMQAAGLACRIEDISSSAWPTAAPRPLNSRLECSRLQCAFGIDRPDWRAALAQMLNEVRATT